jgi:hypothetical protein
MTWTCPACQIAIQRSDETPRPGVTYRCHVCRLELAADLDTGKLVLAPLPGEADTPPPIKIVVPLRAEARAIRPSRPKKSKSR